MENLQSEVIELEFLEFSRGLATISEEDFARILLRYTMLDSSNIEECIKRVRSRTPSEKVRPHTLTLVIFKKRYTWCTKYSDSARVVPLY